VVRLDTEHFPFEATLTTQFEGRGEETRVYLDGRQIDRQLTSIWYRRLRTSARPPAMNPGVHEFCTRESSAALVGTVLGMAERIMSAPDRLWAAEHKLLQLKAARHAGLTIPDTIVTNDADAVRSAFVRFGGSMIAKPVRSGFVDLGSEQRAIYTSRVLEEHLQDRNSLRLSPVIYQPLLPKAADVRVTIVGERAFAVEIDSQSDPQASVDWRRTENPNLPHRSVELPRELERSLVGLNRSLGLSFGAIDLVHTVDDDYVFLEVNPSGQWLWLDDILDLGITRAISSWLAPDA
jgi:glutathione synthase/RimK-type ligase-like ATP-grasp enzyme